MKRFNCPIALFSALLILTGTLLASPDDKVSKPPVYGKVILRFENVFDEQELKLNDSVGLYKNANGDDLQITMFKYYISNISLTDVNGKTIELPGSYFLIDAADRSSMEQELTKVPEGEYTKINYMIGIDSARNFSGAQSGALDPAKGMFWSWNSGYIALKFEGISRRSTSRKSKVSFHIGGSRHPYNTIRTNAVALNKRLMIRQDKRAEINLKANAAALFKGKKVIDFSKLNHTMGGANAMLIADNYSGSLIKISVISD